MHKGRGKTLQSDSCGAKEWGIDRGTDKDRKKSRGKVKGRRERKRERSNETDMTGSKERREGGFLCCTSTVNKLHIEQC